MNQHIIAIGGGGLKKGATQAIDKEIVALTNKPNPRLLFIPTASSDNRDYAQSIETHFSKLGCTVEHLFLTSSPPEFSSIADAIEGADIIYVGGGNTLKMMRRWRFLKIDTLLIQAQQRGAILCGLSAGSICWFKHGLSDSRKDKNPEADYIKVTALGFIDALHCPHYDTEGDRKQSLHKMTRNYAGVAIALDDCAALHVSGTTYRIISSLDSAQAYKVYWKNGIFHEEVLEKNVIKDLAELVSK